MDKVSCRLDTSFGIFTVGDSSRLSAVRAEISSLARWFCTRAYSERLSLRAFTEHFFAASTRFIHSAPLHIRVIYVVSAFPDALSAIQACSPAVLKNNRCGEIFAIQRRSSRGRQYASNQTRSTELHRLVFEINHRLFSPARSHDADKQAAMDALMVDKGDPWNPDPATVNRAHRMCSEVSRVLAPGGVFVQLSFEQAHFRRKFLLGEHLVTSSSEEGNQPHSDTKRGETLGVGIDWEGYDWDLTVHDVQREGGCFGHFLYVMRKRTKGVVGSA